MRLADTVKDISLTDYIAFIALILSVVSFFFTAHVNQKQNSLSIRPLLTPIVGHNSIDIANNGLGPAIIEKIVMIIDNDSKEIKTAKDVNIHLGKHKIPDAYDFVTIFPGTPIKDGEVQNILTSKTKTPKSIKRIKFKINYDDMEGNKYQL